MAWSQKRCIACERLDDIYIRKKRTVVFDITVKTLKPMCAFHKKRYRNRIGATIVIRKPTRNE